MACRLCRTDASPLQGGPLRCRREIFPPSQPALSPPSRREEQDAFLSAEEEAVFRWMMMIIILSLQAPGRVETIGLGSGRSLGLILVFCSLRRLSQGGALSFSCTPWTDCRSRVSPEG